MIYSPSVPATATNLSTSIIQVQIRKNPGVPSPSHLILMVYSPSGPATATNLSCPGLLAAFATHFIPQDNDNASTVITQYTTIGQFPVGGTSYHQKREPTPPPPPSNHQTRVPPPPQTKRGSRKQLFQSQTMTSLPSKLHLSLPFFVLLTPQPPYRKMPI